MVGPTVIPPGHVFGGLGFSTTRHWRYRARPAPVNDC